MVFATLEWQLLECNIAICIQGTFYSQLHEPSHRTCKNAWDASCELRTQRVCGVALKQEPLKRKDLKETFIMPGKTLLFVYKVCVLAEDCLCVCLWGYVCQLSNVFPFFFFFFETIEVIVFKI